LHDPAASAALAAAALAIVLVNHIQNLQEASLPAAKVATT